VAKHQDRHLSNLFRPPEPASASTIRIPHYESAEDPTATWEYLPEILRGQLTPILLAYGLVYTLRRPSKWSG